jgi:hypothetical protein
VRVRPLQVHAQQHGSPVLRFGAPGPCLNIEECAVRIHLAGKHALELQPFHFYGESGGVPFDFVGRPGIGLLGRQFQQLSRVAQPPGNPVQTLNDALQLRSLPPQLLGAVGIVPDAGLLEFAGYFLQALMLVVVIKDTSSRNRCVPRDL